MRWQCKKRRLESTAGFSLLGVLVAISLLSLVSFLLVTGQGSLRVAAKRHLSRTTYEDEERRFIQAVVTGTYKYIQDVAPSSDCNTGSPKSPTPSCKGLDASAQLQTDFNTTLDEYGTMSYSTSPSPWPDSPSDNDINNRCANPQPVDCTANTASFYFCVSFTPNAGVEQPPNSFFTPLPILPPGTPAHAGGAEVYVVLKDLVFNSDTFGTPGANTACAGYLGFTTAGEEIFYSLYWELPGGSRPIFRRKNGALYAQQSQYQ